MKTSIDFPTVIFTSFYGGRGYLVSMNGMRRGDLLPETRMHSSRMYTVRCNGRRGRGVVSAQGGVCLGGGGCRRSL